MGGIAVTSTVKSSSSNITPKLVAAASSSRVITTPTPSSTGSRSSGITSFVGDVLRSVTNSATDGHFGNGNAQQRDGESDAAYWARLAQAGGAAAETFNSTVSNPAGTTSIADAAKAGITGEAVKNAVTSYAPYVLLGVGGLIFLSKFIFKGGGKRAKY